MDAVPAVALVVGSYAVSMLALRRLRVARGRRSGIELELLVEYDHRALGAELAALPAEDAAAGLAAQAAAREAELAPPEDRAAAAGRALQASVRAGANRSGAPPVLAGLWCHLRLLAVSPWNLEWLELTVRRRLDDLQRRHPAVPALHLVRAHLAAALGDAPGTGDELARALYYARGDEAYARRILASQWLERERPQLAAQARAAVSGPPAVRD